VIVERVAGVAVGAQLLDEQSGIGLGIARHGMVMELDEAGMITRWWDYSNLSNLLDNAPQWWLEHIASGWRSTLDA